METTLAAIDLNTTPPEDLIRIISHETREADFYRDVYCCYQSESRSSLEVLTALAGCQHIPEHLRAMLLAHSSNEVRTAASRQGVDKVDLSGVDFSSLYHVEITTLLTAGVFGAAEYREIFRLHQGNASILSSLAQRPDLPDDLIEALSKHQNEEVYLSPLALALSTVPVALALEDLRKGVSLRAWQALGLRADVEIFEVMRGLVADISDPQEYQDKARALMGSPLIELDHISEIFNRFKTLSGTIGRIESNSKLAEAIYWHPKTSYIIKEELTNAGHEIHPIF